MYTRARARVCACVCVCVRVRVCKYLQLICKILDRALVRRESNPIIKELHQFHACERYLTRNDFDLHSYLTVMYGQKVFQLPAQGSFSRWKEYDLLYTSWSNDGAL